MNPSVDKLEAEIWRAYYARQFVVLTQRHPVETAILLRTIADYCRTPVDYANNGMLAEGRAALRSIESLCPQGDAELVAVANAVTQPAAALLSWREGDGRTADRLLRGALKDCGRLARNFGHDYLTSRRIHLAANVARLLASAGRNHEALEMGAELAAVAGGDAGRWRFGWRETLTVPLAGNEQFGISRQLANLERIAGGRREHAA